MVTPSLLPYFWQIYFWQSVAHVDLPPSPRIFDKNHEILGFETCILYYPHYFLRVRGTDRMTQSPFWARLSNKSYKIEWFYFWQYVLWPPPSPTFVKNSFLFNFLTWGWPPPPPIWAISLNVLFLPHSGSILDFQLSWKSCKFQLARWSHEVAILCSWNHLPNHPAQRISLKSVPACKIEPQSGT